MAELLPTPQPTAEISVASAMDPVVDLRDADAMDEQPALVPSPFADRAIPEVREPPPEMIGMYYLG